MSERFIIFTHVTHVCGECQSLTYVNREKMNTINIWNIYGIHNLISMQFYDLHNLWKTCHRRAQIDNEIDITIEIITMQLHIK